MPKLAADEALDEVLPLAFGGTEQITVVTVFCEEILCDDEMLEIPEVALDKLFKLALEYLGSNGRSKANILYWQNFLLIVWTT